jgi:hypothetical protein
LHFLVLDLKAKAKDWLALEECPHREGDGVLVEGEAVALEEQVEKGEEMNTDKRC